MSRGESSGGGQSSLNYLFGSDQEQPSQPPPPKTVSMPPYGIDFHNHNHNPPTARAPSTSQLIDPSQGQHLGNILTVSLSF